MTMKMRVSGRGRDEVFGDRLLHLPLDDGGDGCRERTCDLSRHLRADEDALDLVGECLTASHVNNTLRHATVGKTYLFHGIADALRDLVAERGLHLGLGDVLERWKD